MPNPSKLDALVSIVPGLGTLCYFKEMVNLYQERSSLSEKFHAWRNSENPLSQEAIVSHTLNALSESQKTNVHYYCENESRVYRLGCWGSIVRTTICVAAPILFPGPHIPVIALMGSVHFLSLEVLSLLYATFKLCTQQALLSYSETEESKKEKAAGKDEKDKPTPLSVYELQSVKSTWIYNPPIDLFPCHQSKEAFLAERLDEHAQGGQDLWKASLKGDSQRQELSRLQGQLDSKDEEIAKLEKQAVLVPELAAKKKELKRLIVTLENEKSSLSKAEKVAEAKITKLNDVLEKAQKENTAFKTEADRIPGLLDQIKEKEDRIKTLKQEITTWTQREEAAKNELSELNRTLEAQYSEIAQLKNSSSPQLTADIGQKEKEIEHLREEIKTLTITLEEEKKAVEQKTERLKKELDLTQLKHDQAVGKQNSFREICKKAREENVVLQEENVALRKINESLRSEIYNRALASNSPGKLRVSNLLNPLPNRTIQSITPPEAGRRSRTAGARNGQTLDRASTRPLLTATKKGDISEISAKGSSEKENTLLKTGETITENSRKKTRSHKSVNRSSSSSNLKELQSDRKEKTEELQNSEESQNASSVQSEVVVVT